MKVSEESMKRKVQRFRLFHKTDSYLEHDGRVAEVGGHGESVVQEPPRIDHGKVQHQAPD
jgi:hypothetical protein